MLTDPKLIAILKQAIRALQDELKNKALSTIDTVHLCGKIEAFQEVLNYGHKKPKRKSKLFK